MRRRADPAPGDQGAGEGLIDAGAPGGCSGRLGGWGRDGITTLEPEPALGFGDRPTLTTPLDGVAGAGLSALPATRAGTKRELPFGWRRRGLGARSVGSAG